MGYIILQYTLIVIMVIGGGYFLYLLKDKDIKVNQDYFGITYNILNSLDEDNNSHEKIKSILRLVSTAVLYVENNYKDEENKTKEYMALKFAKEDLRKHKLDKDISEDNIIYIIRLAAALLPPTNKV
ncbi:hypothetical protein [Clostridium sp. DJ247]|uniref:hypothetical protein n=1 Tax=Clostridium sp. DJ247 TaxID=2726188 RepID=UPI0016238FEF|nr:hypothetical protein [Clostridium sp. DJ247]MBC2581594.1 hypothetical protein [Clostridium sp. DJ247]